MPLTMPRPHALLPAALLAALSLPAVAAGEATPLDEATTLDRVVVSASTTRMPVSDGALPNTITVITRQDLDRQLAITHDLSSVLANLVPAFAPSRQKLTSSGESLRGRQPLYLVDGVPQSTPLRNGARDAHTIDPALIERIEILHGANALQGLGASGGVINIITKRAPADDGVFHELSLGASTAVPYEGDGVGAHASWLVGSRRGALDFVGGATYASEGLYYDGDGRAIGVDGTQGDLMDATSWSLFAKTGWTFERGARLQLTLNRYRLQGDGDYAPVAGRASAGIPATSVRGTPEGDPPDNAVDSLSLDYSDPHLLGGVLQAQLFWLDFNALYGGGRFGTFQDPAFGANVFDQSRNVSEKFGGKFGWSRRDLFGAPLHLTLGLDLLRDRTYQELAQTGRLWVPETEYRSVSPFAQAELWLGGKLMLTGGLRAERGKLRVDDYTTLAFYGARQVQGGEPELHETLPNLGAVWYATDTLNLYASYSEGYTVADVGRVLRAVNTPGQRVESLVDLSPVVADNRELGLDYDNGHWRAHLAWYRSDSELGSLLIYDPANNVYNVQRQATEIEGIEADLSLQFTDHARLGVAYAQADGRYDRDQDGRLDTDLEGINISPDRAIAFWEQTWSPRVSTRLQAGRAFDRDFDRDGIRVASFEGYTTADLFARFTLPVGALSVGVENLFGREYITYFSQTTRRDDNFNAGRGRVLSLGWSHRF